MHAKCCKINKLGRHNSENWEGVGSDHCTNLQCRHERCSKCYYLNAKWQPIEHCDGSPVDLDEYDDWYNNFGIHKPYEQEETKLMKTMKIQSEFDTCLDIERELRSQRKCLKYFQLQHCDAF